MKLVSAASCSNNPWGDKRMQTNNNTSERYKKEFPTPREQTNHSSRRSSKKPCGLRDDVSLEDVIQHDRL